MDFRANEVAAQAEQSARTATRHTSGPFSPNPDLDAVREFFETQPCPMSPPPQESPGEYPHTLDLHRKANWTG